MTSRSTWLLIWVLLGLAPAAVLAQLTGTLVADPTRAQATVDVQGTVQGLIAKLTRAGRLQVDGLPPQFLVAPHGNVRYA